MTSAGAGCVSHWKQGVTCFLPCTIILVPALGHPVCLFAAPSLPFLPYRQDSLDDSKTSNQLILGKNSND